MRSAIMDSNDQLEVGWTDIGRIGNLVCVVLYHSVCKGSGSKEGCCGNTDKGGGRRYINARRVYIALEWM